MPTTGDKLWAMTGPTTRTSLSGGLVGMERRTTTVSLLLEDGQNPPCVNIWETRTVPAELTWTTTGILKCNKPLSKLLFIYCLLIIRDKSHKAKVLAV